MSDPIADAQSLRTAMKGMGTDDKKLIEIIMSRSNEALQAIRRAYSDNIGRDLIEDVKSETSGAYKEALVATLLTPAEWDATYLRSCMKGAGTNEAGMIQTLAHRNWEEVQAIKAAYQALHNKSLAEDIEGDTSGLLKKFFLALIDMPRVENEAVNEAQLKLDVEALYNGGEGRWGTDEDAFIRIITAHGPAYLHRLNLAYGAAHGSTLILAMKKEMSGWFADGLEVMVTDHDQYYASLLWKAMDGVGTNEELLVRVITSRRHRLRGISEAFMTAHEKNIKTWVESECGGDLKKVLVALCDGY